MAAAMTWTAFPAAFNLSPFPAAAAAAAPGGRPEPVQFEVARLQLRRFDWVQNTDGIVETDPEHTIDNFAELGNKGSGPLDAAILHMMLNKK